MNKILLVLLIAATARAQNLALLGVSSATAVTAETPQKGQLGSCVGNPGGADFWARAAGKAGPSVLGDALIVMMVRNHDREAKPLPPREREALRPIFGGVVDAVKIVWNARLLDEWRVLGHTFHFGPDSSGQTFGNTIYISHPEPDGTWTHALMHLVVHEMTHTWQAHDQGSLRKFAEAYIRGWWQAGRSYSENWMERQARCVADEQINAAYQRYQTAR